MSSSESAHHLRAAIGLKLDQAFGGEQAKRLAQRRARYAEPLAQRALVQPRAGCEFAFGDQLAQLIGDRRRQRDGTARPLGGCVTPHRSRAVRRADRFCGRCIGYWAISRATSSFCIPTCFGHRPRLSVVMPYLPQTGEYWIRYVLYTSVAMMNAAISLPRRRPAMFQLDSHPSGRHFLQIPGPDQRPRPRAARDGPADDRPSRPRVRAADAGDPRRPEARLPDRRPRGHLRRRRAPARGKPRWSTRFRRAIAC